MSFSHFSRGLLLGSALVVGGCAANNQTSSEATVSQAPANVAQPKPMALTPQQELAKYCRVCVVDDKHKVEEYLPSRLNVTRNGQTYKFCTDNCRKSFDANPQKYILKPT